MAEGCDFSIEESSDAYFNTKCAPCGEGNLHVEAVKYCPHCQENLCSTCSVHHGRQKATRSHNLLDEAAIKQGSVFIVKCRYHPDRDIEMYCAAHDMVYCTNCIATDHRACNGVSGIKEMKTSSIPQTMLERLQNDVRNIQKRLEDSEKNTQKNIEYLEKQRDDIQTKIEDIEKSLIEHIQKLKRDTIDTLNRYYTSVKEIQMSGMDLIANMTTEMKTASSQLRTFTRVDPGQQFAQMKLIQNAVKNKENLFKNIETKSSIALGFAENTDMKRSVISATYLGNVNTVTKNEGKNVEGICKVKGKKEINIKMQNDKETCNIYDVCQLQDGTILLADSDNNKIKRLDANYHAKDECDLDDSPRSICCTGQNEVAVKIKNNTVQFILVGSSLSKGKVISIEDGFYIGMAYCDGELWISRDRGVDIYSTNGTRLKTISKDMDGRSIFQFDTRHMAVSYETFIVTDDCDGAVCLGRRDFTVQREFRNERLVHTKGVCLSSDGIVFMSGYRSNNIVMFDQDGKCLGEIVSKDDGLVNPVSLCYDGKGKCLIVTCASSDKAILFFISN